MSSQLAPLGAASTKIIVGTSAVAVFGLLAALLAGCGSPSHPSSIDALMQTAAAAAGSGQQPDQIVAALAKNGRRAAVFDSKGNRLAGDDLTLAADDRKAAHTGKTVLVVADEQTQIATRTRGGNVLAVTQSGAATGYRAGSVSTWWPVVVTILVGLSGLGVGRLTAPRAAPARRGPADHSAAVHSAVAPPRFTPPPPAAPVTREPPAPSTLQVPQADPRLTSPPTAGIDELARKYLRLVDTANSPALYQEAVNALQSAGLTLIDPAGKPFDPAVHVAVGRRATTDPRSHNVVAETIRHGCYGEGRVMREAEVIVYRTDVSEQP